MTGRKAEAQKQCRKCKQLKAIDEFGRHRLNRDGLKSWCRQCEREGARKRYAKRRGFVRNRRRYEEYHRVVDGVKQKQCSACQEWKDENRFYKHRRHYDGLAVWCKVCADKASNKCRRRRKAMAAEPGLAEIVAKLSVA